MLLLWMWIAKSSSVHILHPAARLYFIICPSTFIESFFYDVSKPPKYPVEFHGMRWIKAFKQSTWETLISHLKFQMKMGSKQQHIGDRHFFPTVLLLRRQSYALHSTCLHGCVCSITRAQPAAVSRPSPSRHRTSGRQCITIFLERAGGTCTCTCTCTVHVHVQYMYFWPAMCNIF